MLLVSLSTSPETGKGYGPGNTWRSTSLIAWDCYSLKVVGAAGNLIVK